MKFGQLPNSDAIDAAIARKRIEDDIPEQIEVVAKCLYEDQSLTMTGNKWDWNMAGDEIRNKWRLRSFKAWWEKIHEDIR